MIQRVFYIVEDLSTSDNSMRRHCYCRVTDGNEAWEQYVNENNLELQKFLDSPVEYQLLHRDLYISAKLDVANIEKNHWIPEKIKIQRYKKIIIEV